MKAHRAALLLLVAACGGTKNSAKNNIAITSELERIEVNQGVRVFVPVTITRIDSAMTDVVVALTAGPEGVLAGEVLIPAGRERGVLELVADIDTEVGSSSFSLSAIADGGDGALSIPLDVLPAAPSTNELIDRALIDGAIDYPTSLLYRGFALVGDERLPDAYRGTGAGEDLGFFREARDPTLPTDTQAALAPFLVRPTDPTSVFYTTDAANPNGLTAQAANCTETDPGQLVVAGYKTKRITAPMRIWVKCSGDEAADDILLESAIGYASAFVPDMVRDFGQPVLDDASIGSPGNLDSAIDLFVVPDGSASLRSGYQHSARAVTVDDGPYSGNTASAYILMGRTRAESSGFKSTFAHEMFHVFQNAYNYKFMFEGNANGRKATEFWWVEASATWASTHYARSLALEHVYSERFPPFQRSSSSLHRSYGGDDGDSSSLMYAAFIWGYWLEHKTGGVGVIKQSWDALRSVLTFDAANQALSNVFDYETNFHEFAIANINENYPQALELDKRHRGLDPRFPEPRPRPTYSHDRILATNEAFTVPVDIAPLRAAYYRYTPRNDVEKVVIHFDDMTVRDGLDIDGVIKTDGNWSVDSYSGLAKKTFCLNRDKVEDIILVLSNHSVPLTQFVLGNLRIEVTDVPCRATWSGALRYELTSNTPIGSQQTIVTANVVLDQADDDGTSLVHFLPRGSFRFTKTGTVGGCVLQVPDYVGEILPQPLYGQLTLDAASEPVRVQSTISNGTYTPVQRADCEPPQDDYDISQPLTDPLFMVMFSEGYTVSEDGTSIGGTKTVDNGVARQFWQWNLTRGD